MKKLKSIFYTFKRNSYLFSKLIKSFSKPVILYTKSHPIYTSVFENERFLSFVFVYIHPKFANTNWLEKLLINKSLLIHADAANFRELTLNKQCVVECEGLPAPAFFEKEQIKKILVESRYSAKDYLVTYAEKVQLCYPSILPGTFLSKPTGRPITFLSVGHGGYIKGFDVLYKLYKTLSKDFDIRLIIAGSLSHNFEIYPEVSREAYERENFDAIYKDLTNDKNVIIKPFKREELLNTVFKEADIYIQFSRMETFGYAILEAMSFGLPIVSCNFRAIAEMVSHSENGFLVYANGNDKSLPQYDVDINSPDWGNNCYNEALVYVTQLLKDHTLRDSMGKKSIEIIQQKFNLKNKIQFLDTLYKEIIANK